MEGEGGNIEIWLNIRTSNCLGSDLLEQCAELIRALEYTHFVIHGEVVKDLLKVGAVIIAIVQSDSNTLSAETPRTANPMQIVLSIARTFACCSISDLGRHVEVDDDLDLWDIDTAS